MTREKLLKKALNNLRENLDCSGYENIIFDLVEEGLKQWDDESLKDFLGIEED